MLLESRIQRLLENIGRRNALPLRVRLWNGHTVDLAPKPRVAITLPRPSAARYFLKPDLNTLGEAVV